MKVVVLAGGMGTRLAEATAVMPKPMVEVGGRPLLWHILKHYAHHGHRDFLLPLGYKGEVIKRFFLDYYHLQGDLTVSLKDGRVDVHRPQTEDWRVDLVDTGLDTDTGGRLLRLQPWLKGEEFLLTYGDGVSDVDLAALLRFHRGHGRAATITAVRPPARFGGVEFEPDGKGVARFTEKPQIGEGWINGGFMVLGPRVFEHLTGDGDSLERDALEPLAEEGQLAAYPHHGFWHPVDTLRELRMLERLWASGTPPWKVWR